jgi:hypothetical protein
MSYEDYHGTDLGNGGGLVRKRISSGAKAAVECPAWIAALKRCATQNQLPGAAEAAPIQNQFELHDYFAKLRVASFHGVPVK